jgi:hypothetical protein
LDLKRSKRWEIIRPKYHCNEHAELPGSKSHAASLVNLRKLTLQPDRVQLEPRFQPADPCPRHRRAFSISLSGTPLDRAHDSTAASPYWATAFLTIQQGMACAWSGNSSAPIIMQVRIIFPA